MATRGRGRLLRRLTLCLVAASVLTGWLSSTASAQPDVGITQAAPVLLYPGAPARALAIRLNNPTDSELFFTKVTARIDDVQQGCNRDWFRLTPAAVPSSGFRVGSRSSITLAASSSPTIRMIESGTNQDACQSARVSLDYSTSARASSSPDNGGSGTDPNGNQGSNGLGGLPFTGLGLGLLVLAAAGLWAAGFILRRLAEGSGTDGGGAA